MTETSYTLLDDERLAAVVAICLEIDRCDKTLAFCQDRPDMKDVLEWTVRERDECTRAYRALGGKNTLYLPDETQ